ncbi:opioid growth factor receptor-like protein 1 isoform X1 [Ctenopharyngodon idella]|uniref:opioid growth factor receptor-like protein 1 isoform X1 n=2 Tax=Ctenopharyngodon idella TaxID=7959 RepID=UPI00223134BB|nr:opioid growth factor receptor-like protein 1 isoform X1 [Ctenopharyngodon idella]
MGNLMGSWRYKEPSTVEECDSTWETDSESDEHQPGGEEEDSGISESMSPADSVRGAEQLDHGSPQFGDMMESSTRMKRSFYAAKDLYKYRHSYPNYKEPRQPNEYRNLRFYLNKIPLVPDEERKSCRFEMSGIYIEEILTKWRGDYEKLEHNHTYIQWLFPLREQGLNFYAQELTQDEIKEFQSTREAKRRFLLAYTIMLDFFGIKLLDKNGNVARAPNWQDRFQHLNESQHNYLRITRILKSLGELGFESFKLPLVRLLLEEALVEGTLPNMRHSALEYFVYTLRQHAQRRALLRFAQRHYHPPENFIWGPPKKKRIPASGSTGTRVGRNEAVERSAGKARSPREGRNNWEVEDTDERKSGEWKTAKGSKVLQEGRGRVDLEEYIETIPL